MFDWQIIVIIILGMFSAIAGAKWQQAKNLLKEAAEALQTYSNTLADDKATKAELKDCLKETLDVIVAFKKLMGK